MKVELLDGLIFESSEEVVFDKYGAKMYFGSFYTMRPEHLYGPYERSLRGIYRPEYGDYFIMQRSSACAASIFFHNLAEIATEDECFDFMNRALDFLGYDPALKQVPLVKNTADTQYNLLGVLMSVNSRLLKGESPLPGPLTSTADIIKLQDFLGAIAIEMYLLKRREVSEYC